MITVGEVIEILSKYNKDSVITDHELADFKHISNLKDGTIILTTKQPIGYCRRSGGYVFPTELEDYLGVVPELDENVDFSEIKLPIEADEENYWKFGKAEKYESKYKKGFDELFCYFDSISDEEQPKLIKRLENLGLI